MKQLSHLRYLLFVLLFATAACGDDEKKQDATPKSHTVEVRYSAANVNGLGATVSCSSVTPEGTNPGNLFTVSVPAAVSNASFAAGQVTSDREFNLHLTFKNVRAAGTTAPAGSYLTADVLVDGAIKKTLRIDNTTAANGLEVTAGTTIMTSQW